MCAVAGAELIRVETNPDTLDFDLAALARKAREVDAKLVFVCDPNNPTGLRVGRREWDAFVPRCRTLPGRRRRGVRRLHRTDGPNRPVVEIDAGRPVVVLRTFSKIFGLAGLRLGYLLAHESLAAHLHAVQEPFNVNGAALAAGLPV